MESLAITDDEEFKRYKEPNPYNYDVLTLERRRQEINTAVNQFPNLDANLITMTWDFIKSKTPEELKELMKE